MDANKTVARCERHPDQSATLRCTQCGAGICRLCIQEFGYFCSAECLEESRAEISPEAVDAWQREDGQLRVVARRTMQGLGLGLIVLCLLLGVWVWTTFIAAPGKAAWTWQPEEAAGSLEIVTLEQDVLTVFADRRIYRIAAKTGKPIQTIAPPFANERGVIAAAVVDNRLLGATASSVFAVAFTGDNHAFTTFQTPCKDVAFDHTGEHVFRLNDQRFDFLAGQVTEPSRIACHRLASEEPLWQIEAEDGMRFGAMLPAGDRLVVQEHADTLYAKGGVCRLTVYAAGDGKRLWRLTFDGDLTWGPALANDSLALQVGGVLTVVDLNGNAQWNASAPNHDHLAHRILGERIFLQQENGSECRNLSTGRVEWRNPTIFDGNFLVDDGRRVLASGFVSKAHRPSGFMSPAADDILADMAQGAGGLIEGLMSKPVLTAIDSVSGRQLWRREGISATFHGDDTALLGLSGVANATLLQMFSAGGNGTTIRQFSLKNGKTLYTRQLNYAIDAHAIADGRLVGVAYGMPKHPGRPVLVGVRLK